MSGIIKTINNLSNRFLYLSRNNLSRIRVEIFFFFVAKTRGGKRDDSRGGSTTSQRVHGWLLTVPVEN